MSYEQVRCSECQLSGQFDDLESNDEGLNLCPECHASTSDIHEGDDDDVSDERSS